MRRPPTDPSARSCGPRWSAPWWCSGCCAAPVATAGSGTVFLADVIAEYERVIHEYNLAAQAAGRPPYEVNAAVQGGPDDTAWQLAIGNVVKAWDAAAAIGQQLHRAERRGYSSGVGAGWYLGSR